MQVFLNTDPHADGRHRMAEHLEIVMNDALGRFRDQVTRVEAHLMDADSQTRTHVDEIHCTLEARLVGRAPVVVNEQAGSAHQALHGAVGKLKRAIATVTEKDDARRRSQPDGGPPPDDTSADGPA